MEPQVMYSVKCVNIERHADKPGELPCCPLCDNAMELSDDVVIVDLNATQALAHECCVYD